MFDIHQSPLWSGTGSLVMSIVPDQRCNHNHEEYRALLNIKTVFRLWDFHYKDKTVVRPSYLYNGNPYTGDTYLYWDGPYTWNSCKLQQCCPDVWSKKLCQDIIWMNYSLNLDSKLLLRKPSVAIGAASDDKIDIMISLGLPSRTSHERGWHFAHPTLGPAKRQLDKEPRISKHYAIYHKQTTRPECKVGT